MNKKIKHILFLIVLLTTICSSNQAAAQHYVGIRGGIGGGTSRFYPKDEMGTVWGLYHGGVSWKYYSHERYVGGLEADLLYMQQGYKRFSEQYSIPTDPTDTTGYYSRKVNTIMVPMFWQPHVYFFQQKMRVFLNLGVTFSYVLSQTEETGSKKQGVISKGDYKMKTTRDNRWGYGLCGGGGVGWAIGKFEVVGEVRYYIGYSDIMRNENKYETNPLRSPLDGLQGAVAVYYRLGKGGIIARPSRKAAAKMAAAEQKQLEKIERKRKAKGQNIYDDDLEFLEDGYIDPEFPEDSGEGDTLDADSIAGPDNETVTEPTIVPAEQTVAETEEE